MNATSRWYTLWVICLLWLLNRQTATAQIAPEAQKRYNAAVKLIQSGDYERAKADLNMLVQQRGPLAPYASYYYAIAAFRQKNFPNPD
ncbi:hypothetical protein [Spirosoma telluris]|uniref:hypothetical protein n=1 Tax=Spirosoma telluris TaxID=2183553 RepID=UPI002FC3AB2C